MPRRTHRTAQDTYSRLDFTLRTLSALPELRPGYGAFLALGMIELDRKDFVSEEFADYASYDLSLPIGYEQTISKPSTVAQMLSLLDVKPGERVLEVGAGSGYVSALLSRLGAQVFAVEKRGFLAQLARKRLDKLGLVSVLIRWGDGKRGWKEHAPFDVIIVSAALKSVPETLLAQLAERGRLLAPVVNSSAIEHDSSKQRFELWQRCPQPNVDIPPSFLREDCGKCNFVHAF